MKDYPRTNETVALSHHIGASQDERVLRVTGKTMQEWSEMWRGRREAHILNGRLTDSKLMTEETMHRLARYYGFEAEDFEAVEDVPLSEFMNWERNYSPTPSKPNPAMNVSAGDTAKTVLAWRVKREIINACNISRQLPRP